MRCAVLLGAGLSSGGTIAFAAVPTAHAPLSATRPKPKKRTTTSEAKRKAARSARKADTTPDLPDVPALLQLVVSPTGEMTIRGGATAEETFGAVPLVGGSTESVTAAGAKPLSGFSASAQRLLSAMTDRARSQLGTRYVFGGNAPGEGLDCSSFARFAMEALGIRLPRTAAQQARVGTAVPRDRKLLRPGDLLTFGRGTRVSHVGIYLGEGRFIHASVTSGQIIETTIERNTRLFRRWQGARRLIAGADSGETAGAF